MRNVIIAIALVSVLFFLSTKIHFPLPYGFLSPLTKQEDQAAKQRLIDKRVFEENKFRLIGSEVSWAEGEAVFSPTVSSTGYIVVDKNGVPVYSLNPDKKLPPASLTKLVTAMVAIDLGREEDLYEVTKEAVNMEPTILMVEEGEKFSLQELLEASLITSANDAAEVLARGMAKKLGGTREVFVMLMNKKVKKLGLKQTQFSNPTGYDDDEQYSTPRELAKIAHYALENYPVIKKLVSTREATIKETELHKYYELPNWNGLLGVYPGVDGIKIGYTEKAGYVTIVTSERVNERFTVVLLGTPDRWARDNWASQLLNAAFEQVGIRPYKVTRMMIKEERETEWTEQLERAKEKTRPWKEISN